MKCFSIIDALLNIVNKQKLDEITKETKLRRYILVTVHRRENWGINLEEIAYGLKKILEKFHDLSILIPMHPNKIVRKTIKRVLGDENRAILIEPLPYDEFIKAIYYCEFILSDSGGLQEEAPSLNKPLLILRDTTERPEAIIAGTAKIIGTKRSDVFEEAKKLIEIKKIYQKMSKAKNPFGDGKASERIFKISKQYFLK